MATYVTHYWEAVGLHIIWWQYILYLYVDNEQNNSLAETICNHVVVKQPGRTVARCFTLHCRLTVCVCVRVDSGVFHTCPMCHTV